MDIHERITDIRSRLAERVAQQAGPIEYVLTPHERDQAKLYALSLERQRRDRNRRDQEQAEARLGIEWLET